MMVVPPHPTPVAAPAALSKHIVAMTAVQGCCMSIRADYYGASCAMAGDHSAPLLGYARTMLTLVRRGGCVSGK